MSALPDNHGALAIELAGELVWLLPEKALYCLREIFMGPNFSCWLHTFRLMMQIISERINVPK